MFHSIDDALAVRMSARSYLNSGHIDKCDGIVRIYENNKN